MRHCACTSAASSMANWVKCNIRVEHYVVFLRLSLLWGFSEHVLYLDNYTMLFCFFEYWYICVLHSIFFEIFVSEIIYFIHQIVMVRRVWHSLSLRNNLFILGRRTTAIVVWTKPFDCEKLHKRDFKLLSRCFFDLCISLCSQALLNLKFGRPPRGTLLRPFQSRQP